MLGSGIHSPEDRRFVGLASGVLDDILVRDPGHATRIGDHRFDGRLPDLTPDGTEEFARVLQRHLHFLEKVDARALSRFAAADLEILRAGVARRIFDLTHLREHEWNPLAWNPADALYSLTAREFAPVDQRAAALVDRLRALPEFLDSARHTLGAMPEIHVRTAMAQMSQIESVLAETLGALADEPGVGDAMSEAVGAVNRHVEWLADQVAGSQRPPALGPELFSGVLQHHLDTAADVDELLASAEDGLERVLDDLASATARYQRSNVTDRQVIPKVLRRFGADSDVTDDTVIDVAADALEAAAAFVSDRDLVTLPSMDLRLEVMPAVFRGVSVAYCDAPGPLDPPELPIVIGIAPTPTEWPTERRASFYREYNRHLLFDLMVHEGVPGHALQLARARQAQGPAGVRPAMPSATFVEGWAVYAEEMMAHRGFVVSPDDRPSLRIQQLKMQLRIIINTILDIRVHTRGMTEAEARRLMATRGFQEEGEIVGKWNRARLTCGQLSTYYVGYLGVAAIVDELDGTRRDWGLRQVHDAVLAHGSVPPSVLRSLVGLE